MELGIHFIDFLPGESANFAPTLVAIAEAAEDARAKMFTLADHFFQMDSVGRAEDPFLEVYTSLSFLAAHTTAIDLTTMVVGVTYRHPGVLAKTASTLDVLSQGRSIFGIGAAWYEREHLGLGVPYPPLRDRFEMLQETLQICLQMWGDNNGPYNGKHYQLAETICEPQPIRRPPILIGGGGEKKTLRLVAQYADVWNNWLNWIDDDFEPDVLKRKTEVLTRHCDTLGRDVADIRKTVGLWADPFDDVDEFLKRIERVAELGVEMINIGPMPGTPEPVGWVNRFVDEVWPKMADIG